MKKSISYKFSKRYIKIIQKVPPQKVPKYFCGLTNVDYSGLLETMIYIWLKNKNEFWFFPVEAKPKHLIGLRWRDSKWIPYYIELDYIDRCY